MVQDGGLKEHYVHGYTSGEQRRLIAQAEFWRDGLILDGTTLAPGTRLLDVGCGVGGVLGVLGAAFPGVRLAGVDIGADQIETARTHLGGLGLEADLRVADARRLPYDDGVFDHVWMMWFLEHLAERDAVPVLREARRVLASGGVLTVIETDYRTIRSEPPSPLLDALYDAIALAMRTFGQDDAGAQLWGWLDEAGFGGIDPGERLYAWRGTDTASIARYVADVVESSIAEFTALPGGPDESTLRRALGELRALGDDPGARMRTIIHKARAVA
jgi:ubiquinone/menaquinone biosynthesis C-methylase UbiE